MWTFQFADCEEKNNKLHDLSHGVGVVINYVLGILRYFIYIWNTFDTNRTEIFIE